MLLCPLRQILNHLKITQRSALFFNYHVSKAIIRTNIHLRSSLLPLRDRCSLMRSKSKGIRHVSHGKVYSVNSDLEELVSSRNYGRKFLGAAIDTGAERSVIGWKQASSYCKSSGVEMKLWPRNRFFKFVDSTCRSMGSLNLKLSVPTSVLYLCVYVVEPDIPLLVDFDLMDKHRLQFLSVSNEL
jgi:hypothetical protein